MTSSSLSYSFKVVLVVATIILIAAQVASGFSPLAVNTGYPPGKGPKECLPAKYRPSNFTVEVDPDEPKLERSDGSSQGTTEVHCTPTQKIFLTHVNGTQQKFFIKGMGYSPIFPSKYTFNRSFDYYIHKYRYLWKRDLEKIKAMGANTIRVWNWDVANSHEEFFDLLHEMGLYILVPFDSFTLVNYPDLTNGKIRQQCLMDWRAFLKSVMYYPAVLGFMIGNELNRHFGAQREGLFSLINNMIAVRNEIDPARHPVTLPLADSGDFKESWIKAYYNWAAIDFWSIQSYRPDKYATTALVEEYYDGYLMHSKALPLKPLVFTEFGTDALANVTQEDYLPPHIDDFPKPRLDQRRQAAYLCEIFSALRDTTAFTMPTASEGNYWCKPGRNSFNTTSPARVVAGAVLMEWNDEWWKAEYADVRARMCPSSRPELHNLCAHNIGDNTTPNYIHEEWLGITAQVYDPTENKACLCPRIAYGVMQDAYTNCNEENCVMPRGGQLFCTFKPPSEVDPTEGDHFCKTEDEMWCAVNPGIIRRAEFSVAGPVVIIAIILLIFCIKFRYYTSNRSSAIGEDGEFDDEGDEVLNMEKKTKLNSNSSAGTSEKDKHSSPNYGSTSQHRMLGDEDEDDNNNNRNKRGSTDSQVLLGDGSRAGGGGGRDTLASHFVFCKEKQDDAHQLQRELDKLKSDIARAFVRFTEVSPSLGLDGDGIGGLGGGGGDADSSQQNQNNSQNPLSSGKPSERTLGGKSGPNLSVMTEDEEDVHHRSVSQNVRNLGDQAKKKKKSNAPSSGPCTCPYFTVSQERLLLLIWDKYCSMENALMIDAVGIVFRQMMEGYHIYRDRDVDKSELENLEGMLEDLALYAIVQTWGGTINHCSEKICEIFEFSRQYFHHVVSRRGDEQAATTIKDFHHGLVEVMRVYYLKVDQAEFSFDDVNTDALIFRKRKNESEIDHFWAAEKEDAKGASSAILGHNYDSQRDARLAVHEGKEVGRSLSIGAHVAGAGLLRDTAHITGATAATAAAAGGGGGVNASAAAAAAAGGGTGDSASSAAGGGGGDGKKKNSAASAFDSPSEKIATTAAELCLLPRPPTERKEAKLHPYLEYHKSSNPEDMLLSYFATRFFALHAVVTKDGSIDSKSVKFKKFMDREEAFPLHGGLFTFMFNYGWIIRYLIWQWILGRFFQPVTGSAPMCVCELTKLLAMSDSGWMMFSGWCHRRILGVFKPRVIFECVFYSVAFVGLIAYNFILEPDQQVSSANSGVTNLFGAGKTANSFYVIAAILITTVDEVLLLVTTTPPFGLPARFRSHESIQMVRICFVVTLLAMTLVFFAVIVPTQVGGTSLIDKLSNLQTYVQIWPSAATTIAVALLAILLVVLPYSAARFVAYMSAPSRTRDEDELEANHAAAAAAAAGGYKSLDKKGDNEATPLVPPPSQMPGGSGFKERPEKVSRSLREEAQQLGANLVFWGFFFLGNFLVNYEILIPSVKNIDFTLCTCDPSIPQATRIVQEQCTWTYQGTCVAAVIFTWVSVVLVSFTVMYSVFAIELLTAGFFRAKYLRVGNIKTWEEVEEHWHYINEKCLPRLSGALDNPGAYSAIWNCFVDALYKDSLLSSDEMKRLKCPSAEKAPNLRAKPRSEEAFRRITYHLWSLESALNHQSVGPTSVHTTYRARHRVRTMPPWTVLVPCYDETVIFTEEELTNTKVQGKAQFRISTIEYLAHTYHDEWDNFAERMKINGSDKSWIVSKDTFSNDLLQSFLRAPGAKPLSEDLKFEIRWWATMRGQTLARTIAGLVNWRDAIVALMRLEEGPDCSEAEIQAVASRKCQILISHQTANPFIHDCVYHPSDCAREESIELTFRRLKHFEVAYSDDSRFISVTKRVKPEVLASDWGKEDVKYQEDATISLKDSSTVKRKKYNLYRSQDYDFSYVQRVGRLRIGEGKAENQMHALQFVRGAVLQAMDMNQYTTTENGFKVPYLLSDYFGTPAIASDTHNQSVIPEFRILGFPEWAYTRSLSMVGEFMGAAEWCFVTITQRVLDWPLRIRAHYGHPDFFDAYWVRNRGGQSKASRLVNTNEDIFAAYEMFGRGDKGAFVEFLEAQKGRESTFGGACVFEAKLAQGGAQQVRSFDLYRLNRNLNIFDRYALCFSSLAFYFTNLVMAISVMYYMLSIALFAVSGVTFHRLGLMDSAIAVPWLFQIGYVLAFPYVMELTIQHGFLKGFAKWLRNLLPAIIFFVFHLRTKMYFFAQGILMGKGGYSATGRGFGLDRTSLIDMFKAYSASHFKEALTILAVLVVYAVYGTDPVHVYLLRCASILVIVISWMWAPVIFNPVSTASDLQEDLGAFVWWMVASRRPALNKAGDVVTLEALQKKLKAIHFGRVLTLVNLLANECRDVLSSNIVDLVEQNVKEDAKSPGSNNKNDASSSSNAMTATKSEGMGLGEATRSEAGFAFDDMLNNAIPEAQDISDAFTRVLEGLNKGKPKLEAALKKLNGGNMAPPGGDVQGMINEYWGQAEKESWIGWYLKGDIMLQWEAEDQFFPGLLNLTVQKAFMNIELMAPWIILASDRFHLAALWFLGLIVSLMLLNRMVNWGFAHHHEHMAVGKAAILIPIPFAIAYYVEAPITFAETLWSLIMFDLLFVFIIRSYYGFANAKAKYNTYGMTVRPFLVGFEALTAPPDASVKERLRISVSNRSQETDATNSTEEKRLRLFASRMGMPLLAFHVLSVITPVVSLMLMCIANFLVVIMSGMITTMNLNGRVSEAWKKAYLRPAVSIDAASSQSSSSSKDGGGGGPGSPTGGATGTIPSGVTLSQREAQLAAHQQLQAQNAQFVPSIYGGMMQQPGSPTFSFYNQQAGHPLNRDVQLQQTYLQDVESATQGSISASLVSQAGASMRAVRSRARGTAASQSILGRAMNSMINRPQDDAASDVVSVAPDGMEPFMGGTTSRILMGNQSSSTANLGKR